MYEITIKSIESKDALLSKILYKIRIDKDDQGLYRGSIYKGLNGRLLDTAKVSTFDESYPPYQLLKLVLQRFSNRKDQSAGSTEAVQAPPK